MALNNNNEVLYKYVANHGNELVRPLDDYLNVSNRIETITSFCEKEYIPDDDYIIISESNNNKFLVQSLTEYQRECLKKFNNDDLSSLDTRLANAKTVVFLENASISSSDPNDIIKINENQLYYSQRNNELYFTKCKFNKITNYTSKINSLKKGRAIKYKIKKIDNLNDPDLYLSGIIISTNEKKGNTKNRKNLVEWCSEENTNKIINIGLVFLKLEKREDNSYKLKEEVEYVYEISKEQCNSLLPLIDAKLYAYFYREYDNNKIIEYVYDVLDYYYDRIDRFKVEDIKNLKIFEYRNVVPTYEKSDIWADVDRGAGEIPLQTFKGCVEKPNCVYYKVDFYNQESDPEPKLTLFRNNIDDLNKKIFNHNIIDGFIPRNQAANYSTDNCGYRYKLYATDGVGCSYERPQKNLKRDEKIFFFTVRKNNSRVPEASIYIQGNKIKKDKESTYEEFSSINNNSAWKYELSQDGTKSLIDHEGLIDHVYIDPEGYATFGIGCSYAGTSTAYYEKEVWGPFKKSIEAARLTWKKVDNGHLCVYKDGVLLQNVDGWASTKWSNYGVTVKTLTRKFCSDAFKSIVSETYLNRAVVRLEDADGITVDLDKYCTVDVSSQNYFDNKQNWEIARNLTQEQFDIFVDTVYQGNKLFFRLLNYYYKEANNNKTYKTFCDCVKKVISTYETFKKIFPYNKAKKISDFLNIVDDNAKTKYNSLGLPNYIKAYSYATTFLRGNQVGGWWNKIKEAFTVYGSETTPTETTNEETEIKQIVVTCYANKNITLSKKFKIEDVDEDGKPWPSWVFESFNDEYFGIEEPIIYSIILNEEDLSDEEIGEEIKVDESKLKLEEIDGFLKKWVVKSNISEINEQSLLDVNGYYDFYSGMTPYIEASFKNGENNWRTINSKDHPYFKSLTIEDTGVKKAELVLFDKDFASYQYGVFSNGMEKIINKEDSNGKYPAEVYSLETLIKEALKNEVYKNKKEGNQEVVESYQPLSEDSTIGDDFLKISNYTKSSSSYENLKLRYGYCDYNPRLSHKYNENDESDKARKEEKRTIGNGNGNDATNILVDDERYFNYFKNKNGGNETSRTSRWWDVKNGDASKVMNLTGNFSIETNAYVSGQTTNFSNKTADINATDNENVGLAQDKKIQSYDQTTSMSYEITYMITNLSTSLKPNGIEYHISAIESINSEIMNKRFLQRYAEISTYPLEVLYLLMRIFNETSTGTIPAETPKILLLNDESGDFTPSKWLNMVVDSSKLTETQLNELKSIYTNEIEAEIRPEWLKNISLKFGSEAALKRNYNASRTEPGLYKSVASLLDDFCYSCVSKKVKSTENEVKGYDNDGNEIQKTNENISAPLRWMVVKNKKPEDKNVYVVLYYRKPRKIPKIRKYTWGPENFYHSVVKDIKIQNNNEFALLSGISTFNGSLSATKFNVNPANVEGIENETPKNIIDKMKIEDKNDSEIASSYNKIFQDTTAEDKYNVAYSNCMYSGSIDILGDPGLYFNTVLQPYTYPIRLDIILPKNELYYKGFATADWQNDYWNKKKDVDKTYGRKFYVGNQRLHEMSGYYVIAKITHNISPSGFTTTLDISSYPGIEKDVLINTNKVLS